MLAIERKNEILARLRQEQRVLVNELAAHYGVTEETIRRDLDKLEKEGFATKTYGGAILGNNTKIDISYNIRSKTNVEAKTDIARIISDLICDGDHLMLDDSSTSLYVAKQLKEKKNLTIITYSVEIVAELSGTEGFTILCTGGQLRSSTLSFEGHQVTQALSRYHVDKAILSCKGIDPEAGITDSADAHALSKQAMLRAAKQTILAVDNSKFDKVSFVQVGPIDSVHTIVTNQRPDPTWTNRFQDLGITCRYPAG